MNKHCNTCTCDKKEEKKKKIRSWSVISACASLKIGPEKIFPEPPIAEDILPVDLIRWPGEDKDESNK